MRILEITLFTFENERFKCEFGSSDNPRLRIHELGKVTGGVTIYFKDEHQMIAFKNSILGAYEKYHKEYASGRY